jgi:predicted nuclease of restriction endonuclease-like (RecB) superfamily
MNKPTKHLLGDIRNLIESTRQRVAQTVNSGLVLLYWSIGKKIREVVLKDARAAYGQNILSTLSTKLVGEYGKGFSHQNLLDMVRLNEVFSQIGIVSTLSRQLGWSHFKEFIYIDDPLKRDFYAEMCRIECWSVRTLRKKIGGMLFERTALSKKPTKLAKMELAKLQKDDRLTPDLVFRDPYFLDFLGLKNTYQEKDLEAAILREMESFILELGAGFSFIARQKRISIGPDDFYLDLLFYHRKLRRLVAIELKLEKFKPGDKGQMELYLRWLNKHERREGEEAPIGLILCAGKSEEQIELLELEKSGIRVAGYLTELPPRKLLQRKLHQAIQRARLKLG